ncbi:MAG TPA: MBL fold metallo-hydrolase [Ktedonobacterales bacterium]|nr:MBL fold metallo-hydrolase [Ktedonobacterales bacterium]
MSTPASDYDAYGALPAGVARILAPNPSVMTGPGTNTFLVADETAGAVVVIDPGPDMPDHLRRIAAEVGSRGAARAILVTHGHPDHAEGAATLRALLGVPVYAWSRQGVPAMDVALADDEIVPLGARRLRALYTPGHRFDHLCFLLEDSGALFAGDLIAGEGTVVIAPPEGDLLDYMASLRRLRALDPRLILPAHGPLLDQPQAVLDYYIAHRDEREQQVLAALAAGPQPIMELVRVVYAEVNPELHPLAAQSLLAHLQKLEREGRVHRQTDAAGNEQWSLGA